MRTVPGTRSVLAERATGGFFLDIDIDRDAIARYGMSIADVQMTIETAIGGEPVTTTVEGRERYTVSVRYPRELRGDPEAIARVLVPTMDGRQVPLGQLAAISLKTGPSMLRNENGLLAAYVFADFADSDIGGYVGRARQAVRAQVALPAGYTLVWSGQYESMQRVAERLKLVVPVTLAIVFFIIYLSTRSLVKTSIVLLAVPFSAIGAIWLLWALGYNMSIAVWVGIISLLGLDAETGMFMLLYLDLAHKDWQDRGKLRTLADVNEAVVYGAVRRIRPKLMMVAVNFFGLLPVMLGTGTGAEMMKRVAAPMVGGLFTSLILELLVYPAIYSLWRERQLRNGRSGVSLQDTEGIRLRALVAGARGRLGWG